MIALWEKLQNCILKRNMKVYYHQLCLVFDFIGKIQTAKYTNFCIDSDLKITQMFNLQHYEQSELRTYICMYEKFQLRNIFKKYIFLEDPCIIFLHPK